MVPLSFAGQQFFVAGDAALWLPSRRALLVADLHLEKASWFAAAGQMLPPYDSLATLEALARLVDRLDPAQLYCLGDNYHDDGGEARLGGDAAELLQELTDRLDWHWISGNHDRAVSGRWGGAVCAEIELDGICLRHEADPDDPCPEISGHFHPKLRMTLRHRHIARRCFVRNRSKLILPAFGSLTGGLDAGHAEIARACAAPAEALVALDDRLACFPIGACETLER